MYTNSECSIRENQTPSFAGTGTIRAGRLGDGVRAMQQALATAARRYRQRARLRRDLERLDLRQLHDIGLRRADLEIEAGKPFWRA